MVKYFKKSLFRLALSLSLFLFFLAMYMRSMEMGVFYHTVDGYLLVLPIARTGFMLLAVGAFLGMVRPFSETVVGAVPLLVKRTRWRASDPIAGYYRDFIYYPLLLLAWLAAYFMLIGALRAEVSLLQGFRWLTLVFSLVWLAAGLAILYLCVVRLRRDWPLLLEFRAENKTKRMSWAVPAHMVPPARTAGMPAPTVAGPLGRVTVFCPKCGKELNKEFIFCPDCGSGLRGHDEK